MNYKKLFISAMAGISLFLLQSDTVNAQQCDTIIADFSSNAPRCTGSAVDFLFTQNAYATMTYLWDFGSGASPATSTAKDPSGITYSTAGLKLVTLTVTHPGLGCTDTKTTGINIIEMPNPAFTDNGPQCEEAEVNFTYTGTNNTGWIYSWDFGTSSNPAVSSAQSPGGVKYFSPGTKSVNVTVTNGMCNASVSRNVTIQNKPSAGFSNAATSCTGDSVNFTNTGSTGLTYAWNFGSGASPATSTSENPQNVFYTSNGSKNIQQIVTQGSCSDTSLQAINIIQTPSPSFTTNAPQCEGAEVNFTYSGTTGTGWTYSWDFGNGSTPNVSSAQNPLGILYTGSGSKSVSLTVTNQTCSENTTQNITINATPGAGLSVSSPACTNDSVNFSNTGSSGLTYSWKFGAGASPATSTQENPLGIMYSSPGIKNISQIITQGTCTDTAFGTVSVTETPIPTFTHNAPQCEGAEVNFTYSGSTGASWTYLWDFGSGASPALSAGTSPSGITYTGVGSKTVTLTVTNQLCSETTTQNININFTPTANFSSNAPACTGDSVNFLNGGSTGVTYNWSFDAGASPATSTLENPVGIIYSTNGTKSVRQIVSQGTCVDTAIMSINIGETPAPNYTHNAPQCEGAPVNFTYSGNSGTGWTYLWDFGNGASPALSAGVNPGGIVYTGSGSKNVSVTVTNQLCSETSIQTITINPTPTAGFSSNAPGCTGDSVNFLNGGSSGLTYAWNFGSNATPATSTSESPLGIIYSSPGIKTVQQIIFQGTCSDTSTTTINVKETPAPAFTDNGPRCEGSDVNFAYTGSTGTGWTYTWDFGNGSSPSTSSALSPSGIQYTGAGTKNITLTVNNQGCSDTAFKRVIILFQPSASMSTSAPGCTGDTVLFNNTGTSGVIGTTYLWAFGNGSPSSSTMENPPPVIFPNAGVETISLAITSGACSDTIFENITIDETPSINITSNAPVCATAAVSFVNQGSNGSRWNFIWDFGSGSSPSISTSETPTNIRYNAGGSKTVNLTVSDSKCSNSDMVTINIFNLPVSDAGKDTTICADRCVQIGSDSSTTGSTYTWFPSSTLDDGFISNPLACPKASINMYFITVVDMNNCVSRDTVTVTMLQSAIANAGPDIQGCEGDTIQIGAALIEGQKYVWTPAAGLSSDTVSSPLAFPDSTTPYKVTVSYKSCDIIEDDVVFTVYKNPIVNAGPDVKIARGASTQLLATGGIMYQWTPVLGLSNPGIFNPVASPDETTIYIVEVTDQNSCQNMDSVMVTVVNADIWAPDAFTPNGDGANDVFYIRNNGVVQFQFMVYNRNGELIFFTTNPDNGWDGTRQGTGEKMPSGAYVYSAKGELSDGNPFVQSGMINLIR